MFTDMPPAADDYADIRADFRQRFRRRHGAEDATRHMMALLRVVDGTTRAAR